MRFLQAQMKSRILIAGTKNCGKSTLISTHKNKRYLDENFKSFIINYNPIVRLSYFTSVKFSITITDNLNENDLLSLSKKNHKNFLFLCYSVDNKSTFDEMRNKYKHYFKYYNNVTTFLIALKTELRDSDKTFGPIMEYVSVIDGMDMKRDLNAFGFFEVSAKNNVNVDDIFYYAAEIMRFRNQKNVAEFVFNMFC